MLSFGDCQKGKFKFLIVWNFLSNDSAETPKSPEGDFKAALALGEKVWRGEMKVNLQFESYICKILTFETASCLSWY